MVERKPVHISKGESAAKIIKNLGISKKDVEKGKEYANIVK